MRAVRERRTVVGGFQRVRSIGRSSKCVAHASAGETLVPGDVLGSGTVGTGAGIEIDRWLRPDDIVRLEIDGIGALETQVVRTGATAPGS